jgi:Lon protease-like protein
LKFILRVAENTKIPMFPLTIFPLPGELVPLHIFLAPAALRFAIASSSQPLDLLTVTRK